MVATLGTSMLGLTFGCARCHAHKYDPIPQEDYYRLIACFSHTDPQDTTLDPNPGGFKQAKLNFDKTNDPLVMARAKFEKVDLPERLREIVEAGKDMNFSWITLDAVPSSSKRFKKTPTGNLYQLQARTYLKDITGIRIEASLGKKFVPVELKVTAAPLDETADAVPVETAAIDTGSGAGCFGCVRDRRCQRFQRRDGADLLPAMPGGGRGGTHAVHHDVAPSAEIGSHVGTAKNRRAFPVACRGARTS